MLKKLRFKFIALTMVTVTLVMGVSFATICVIEQQRANTNLEAALEQVVNRAGDFLVESQTAKDALVQPDQAAAEDTGTPNVAGAENGANTGSGASGVGSGSGSGSTDAAAAAAGSESLGAIAPDAPNSAGGPQIGGPDRDKNSQYPIATYLISEDGTLNELEQTTTAFISGDTLAVAAVAVSGADDGYGTLNDSGLHYLKRSVNGYALVAFADSSSTNAWQSLALTLGLVGAATISVFFVLVWFFSKWALKPVVASWEAQKQFVADASHELKTPLTVVLANTSILLSHPSESIASQSKWLESTQVEAQHMQSLVSEMLTLAQVETPAAQQFETVDLSDLANEQLLQFESVAFEQGFALESQIDDSIKVWGSTDRLRKLTGTLIENASKYVNDGGTVRATLARSGKNALLSVSNTGSFIAPEDIEHVFDRFYRTDKARTSEAGGFGLGLAIAQEIAQSHKGSIVVKSSPEAGTTFTVTLPLQSAKQ